MASVAVIGAGWAGLAAAVQAVQAGHQVTVFEASPFLGGRARGVEITLSDGARVILDNGQHVLLGAYRQTLELLQSVGVDLEAHLIRLSVTPSMFQTKKWTWRDYGSLLLCMASWMRAGFVCAPEITAAQLCRRATWQVMTDLWSPLCLSALNTPLDEASGQVFLRVMRDAFLGKGYAWKQQGRARHYKSSDMLIPRFDLTCLLPGHAADWLQNQGARICLGTRITHINLEAHQWQISFAPSGTIAHFDRVIVATPAKEAARLLRSIAPEWAQSADALVYHPIATVYAQAAPDFDLPKLMMPLPTGEGQGAQFVFAKSQAKGLLAFVVSHAQGTREEIEQSVLQQGSRLLGTPLQKVLTLVDRRATFACKANMKKTAKLNLAGLSVVGDYVDNPYPATLEGAVMSGLKGLS